MVLDVSDFSWCGLAVNFKEGILVSKAEDADVDDHRAVTIEKVRSVLLNNDLKYPKMIYNRLAGVGYKKDKKKWKKWRHDILFLSLGVAGVEYVKTEGWKYVSKGKDVPILVETILGSITVLLQRNADCFKHSGIMGEEQWFCAKKIFSIDIPIGRKVVIPPGYYVVFVNKSLNPAAVSIIVDKDAEEVAAPFSESRGAAYYAIKKNARQEIVPNPMYRNHDPIRQYTAARVWAKMQMQTGQIEDLLYTFLAHRHELFDELLSDNEEAENDLFAD